MNNTYPWVVLTLLLLLASLPLFSQISISGNAQTEDGFDIENVIVTISGNGISTMTIPTDANGNFTFNALPDNQEYKICMEKNIDHLNGVSTFDLVLTSKHILGVTPLNSPYKIIAADVSNNRLVTVLDLTLTRSAILGVITEFPDSPSWRFIPADHVFGNPSDPFSSPFPERCKCVTANGNVTGVDFIAIKTGDVNGSAASN